MCVRLYILKRHREPERGRRLNVPKPNEYKRQIKLYKMHHNSKMEMEKEYDDGEAEEEEGKII